MPKPFRVVILGGYGNFGARIAKRLNGHPNLELVITGRSLDKASTLAAHLKNQTNAAYLDAYSDTFAHDLLALKPNLVIHTAGPFQGQDYRIPKLVAEAGAHYIDLADGRRFVCDFASALNETYEHAGKLAITGASTVPALSSAVIDHLSNDFSKLDSIEICIAPAQTAPRGVATLAGVLDYCGEQIQVFRNGQWGTAYGWDHPVKIHFKRLKPRLGALCDIPDLELFPVHYEGVQTVMFRAALEVKFTQIVFAILARLRRARLLPHLARFAKVMQSSAKLFDVFGSALGGMVIEITGRDQQGKSQIASWHIAADHDYGPEIPCMAAILLARKLADGKIHQVGATPCMSLLTLSEFEPEFKLWNMQTDIN